MSLYAIILDKPSEDAWKRIKETWDAHHFHDSRLALIVADDRALTADIAEKVGISNDGASGLVVQMNYFAGHSSSSLAEWIAKNS